MSEAAKDSRSALKVSPGLRPWAGVGLGAVGGDCTSRQGTLVLEFCLLFPGSLRLSFLPHPSGGRTTGPDPKAAVG